MTAQDRAYYMRRAEAELALATCAAHPAAMRAHYHLAGFYLDKAYGPLAESRASPPFLAPLSNASSDQPIPVA